MYVLVKDIIEKNLIEGSRLVAGKSGAGNPLLWVNVMEILDAPDSLQQGELLVTTGYQLDNMERYRDLVLRLKSRGVCGLAIQTGYYIHSIPPYILSDADRYGLPVIELPSQLTFSHILHTLLGAIGTQNEVQSNLDISLLKDGLRRQMVAFEKEGPQEGLLALFLLSPSSFNPFSLQPGLSNAVRRFEEYFASQSPQKPYVQAGESQVLFAVHLRSDAALQNMLVEITGRLTPISREEHVNLLLGVSELSDPPGADAAVDRAVYVCQVLRKVGAKKAVCHERNVRFFEWFDNFYQKENSLSFAYDILRPLINYDYFHKSEYLKTLRLFLASDCKLSETAELLFIHRHTMKNRVEKMEQMCNIRFSDYYTRLHFSIALIIYDCFLS